ncbi:uncharacterized protein MICPUCDRAFT_63746 [Micromonas pusilla CCMP1545]|uniref:Predicted protein n=1 Tax=Micromonas pusilla (strain CCMP1545) TaxID=564608 RepID=C1N5Q5_MICPC|nr:uncharacterized protein MICPUCDRAFT_63746 [Micromonas pusilla CCMP1545]EEH52538.1 predicted protein [Micromonas pusilla CCMP1545]|eukprot:XP_003063402.1 predicted protein [Micromonas pusilla CCMP1545]
MFAIAAAPVVRAAATVKASKAAAKEQKSACAPAPVSRGVDRSIGKTGIVSPRSYRPRRFSASLDARTANVSAARVRRVRRAARARRRYRRPRPRDSRATRERFARVAARRIARRRARRSEILMVFLFPASRSASGLPDPRADPPPPPLLPPQRHVLQGCRRRRGALPPREPRRARGRPHAPKRHQPGAGQIRAALLRPAPGGERREGLLRGDRHGELPRRAEQAGRPQGVQDDHRSAVRRRVPDHDAVSDERRERRAERAADGRN